MSYCRCHLLKWDFEESFSGEGLRQAQEIFNDDKTTVNYILLDWNLTDGKGSQVHQSLRKLDDYNKVPILLITANDDIEDLLGAIEEGATDYIIKPWSQDELEDKIAECWMKHS